jgi:O-antigen ligase
MFNRDNADYSPTGFAQLALPVAVVAVALLAGSVTAMAGALVGPRAIYYVAVMALLVIGGCITLTRAEPMRFAFLSLVALLPFVAVPVPPARLGLMIFDVAMLLLGCGLLLQKGFGARGMGEPLFPGRSLAIIWLLLLPCAVFARHPARAGLMLVLMFAAYLFFWLALQELRRPGGLERIVGLLSVVLILLSGGLFLDGMLHVNFSLMGSNPNQKTWNGGQMIWRAGGFFQDPQRAAAFLVSLLSFLLVLSLRRRIRGRLRALAWAAILCGVPALFLTVSRSAILSFVLVSGAALVAVNRWPAVLKVTVCMVLLSGAVLTSVNLTNLLPAPVAQRLVDSGSEFQTRKEIWFDTWDMFATRPLTGIGFGGFQRYLLETRPGQTNYYGVGVDTGEAYVPDQPESGWFKILYEGGIVGSLAALLLIGDTLRRAVGGIIRTTDPDTRTELVAALAGLVTFGVTFTTLFTTADRRLLMLFALLLAVIWRVAPAAPPAAGRA